MMCYKDKTYCMASSDYMCKKYDIKYCNNTDCWRHASEIPDDLPEWEPVAWSDFSQRCKTDKGLNYGFQQMKIIQGNY